MQSIAKNSKEIQQQEWYELLVEECKAIIVERVYRSKQEIIECWHEVGQRILDDPNYQKFAKGNLGILRQIAGDLGKSYQSLYFATAFYSKFPVLSNALETMPEGKLVSWHDICNKYLYPPVENKIEIPIPDGKYSTIVIDPPWPVAVITRNDRHDLQELPYPTMSVEEIKRFPINQVTTDNCNLFLWTTHAFLPIAFNILEEWGFNYHVCLTWDKGQGYTLFNFYRKTEFVLYAYKGKMVFNKMNKNIPTVFAEKGRGHSRKPDIFYDLVREFTPEPRIDIFSREKREGFAQWGNETEKFNNETNNK
jgi:N6-adenosine-specific RNA methylase IME4